MKRLTILCAVLFASAALASPVSAATNLNSSRSNIYKIDGKALTEADCAKKGGTVGTDQEGNKICTMPEAGIAVTDPESSDVGRGDSK
ncbi:MAG: hypothetical protein ACT4OG_07245 [Alphaproteobacteria bacterium]